MKVEKMIEQDIQKLEKSRELRGWTQERMAQKLKVSRQTYNEWINGVKKPNRKNWNKIKRFLEG